MQEITIRRNDILEPLKDGKTIVLEYDNIDYSFYTINERYIGLIPKEYVLYFDSYDYETFDDDDEVIDFLKDAFYRIEDVKVKII